MGLNATNIDEDFGYNYTMPIDTTKENCGTYPDGITHGWLTVINNYNEHFITQIAYTCNGTPTNNDPNRNVKMWIRERYFKTTDGSVWSNWNKIYTSSELDDLQHTLFSQLDTNGNTTSDLITEYPTEPGVYRVGGNSADIGFPSPWGTLVIFKAGTSDSNYKMHLYVNYDSSLDISRMWFGRTNGNENIPTWVEVASTDKAVCYNENDSAYIKPGSSILFGSNEDDILVRCEGIYIEPRTSEEDEEIPELLFRGAGGSELIRLRGIETPYNDYDAANKEYVDTKFAQASGFDGGVATQSSNGLMSAADKKKLDGIADNATANTSTATQSSNGLMSAADKKKLDGIADNATANTSTATTSANGLMSAADKKKLDGIADNATKGGMYRVLGNGNDCLVSTTSLALTELAGNFFIITVSSNPEDPENSELWNIFIDGKSIGCITDGYTEERTLFTVTKSNDFTETLQINVTVTDVDDNADITFNLCVNKSRTVDSSNHFRDVRIIHVTAFS